MIIIIIDHNNYYSHRSNITDFDHLILACAHSCQAGYIPDSNCFECTLNDICAASNPCQNSGQCTVVGVPNQYVCNCSTSAFNGENCSG